MFHRTTLQDVVPVKFNPAYEQVNLKRIKTKKNNAYTCSTKCCCETPCIMIMNRLETTVMRNIIYNH